MSPLDLKPSSFSYPTSVPLNLPIHRPHGSSSSSASHYMSSTIGLTPKQMAFIRTRIEIEEDDQFIPSPPRALKISYPALTRRPSRKTLRIEEEERLRRWRENTGGGKSSLKYSISFDSSVISLPSGRPRSNSTPLIVAIPADHVPRRSPTLPVDHSQPRPLNTSSDPHQCLSSNLSPPSLVSTPPKLNTQYSYSALRKKIGHKTGRYLQKLFFPSCLLFHWRLLTNVQTSVHHQPHLLTNPSLMSQKMVFQTHLVSIGFQTLNVIHPGWRSSILAKSFLIRLSTYYISLPRTYERIQDLQSTTLSKWNQSLMSVEGVDLGFVTLVGGEGLLQNLSLRSQAVNRRSSYQEESNRATRLMTHPIRSWWNL